MNVKKTKSSKKIVLKITMSMTGAYFTTICFSEQGEIYQVTLCDQMSWKLTLETIEARVPLHLDAKSRSLRCWKVTIEKAYANFQVDFPGFKPDLFTCLVIATDGRSEGSDFPNLIEPKERECYGI